MELKTAEQLKAEQEAKEFFDFIGKSFDSISQSFDSIQDCLKSQNDFLEHWKKIESEKAKTMKSFIGIAETYERTYENQKRSIMTLSVALVIVTGICALQAFLPALIKVFFK